MSKLTMTIISPYDDDSFTQDLQKVLELLKMNYENAKLEGSDRSIVFSIDRSHEDGPANKG